MKKKPIKNFLFFIQVVVMTLVFASCAGQVPPSGGPIDTTPPEIVNTYPPQRTVRFNDNKLIFEFSEYVHQSDVERSIFISPSVGELVYDWSGTKVEVQFSDTLRRNTTYVVTIGTDVRDRRNNNRMQEAFSLAFSTADYIDSGRIAGKVFDKKPEGILIFAYLQEDKLMDTLNPSLVKPDYLTQTSKDGSFFLPYLRLGTYRLYAIRDEYKNLVYDTQIDQFGLMPYDINLTEGNSFVAAAQFQLTSEDTSRPFITAVRSLDVHNILIRFSEPMDTSSLHLWKIVVTDTMTGNRLPLLDLAFTPPAIDIHIVTSMQESSQVYRVQLSEMYDSEGNYLRQAAEGNLFVCYGTKDTSKPYVQITSSGGDIRTLLPKDSLVCLFTEPVLRSHFERGLNLLDSAKQSVPGTFRWQNSMLATFVPTSPLALGMSYQLSIPLDSVVDVSGNCYADSVLTLQLSTVSAASLGSIEGIVEDEANVVDGKIVVLLQPIGKEKTGFYSTTLDQPGKFFFGMVPEGKYTISAFSDRDGDGVYTYGKPFPFQPSERFLLYPDTLKVRARWPLEGVSLKFK